MVHERILLDLHFSHHVNKVTFKEIEVIVERMILVIE